MNTNAQTLTRFYTAFAALDADTMASCYAPKAGLEILKLLFRYPTLRSIVCWV